jgi:hypothetical protein
LSVDERSTITCSHVLDGAVRDAWVPEMREVSSGHYAIELRPLAAGVPLS